MTTSFAVSYLACPPGVGIGLQKVPNEVFGVITDILPVPFMEDDTSVAALFDEILEVFAAEG